MLITSKKRVQKRILGAGKLWCKMKEKTESLPFGIGLRLNQKLYLNQQGRLKSRRVCLLE